MTTTPRTVCTLDQARNDQIDGKPEERRGRAWSWRLKTGLAIGLITTSGVLIGLGTSTATAATLHDTWGHQVPRFWALGHPRAVPHAGARSAAGQATTAPTVSSHASLAAEIEARAPARLDTVDQQVLDALNAARAQFGLEPGIATDAGRALVLAGAKGGTDPGLLPVSGAIPDEYSIWGAVEGISSPGPSATSAVMSAWLYKDGWLGSATENLDCTSPSAPGCNGHRRAVLSSAPVPGAKLYVDLTSMPTTFDGHAAVSIAALLIWVAP